MTAKRNRPYTFETIRDALLMAERRGDIGGYSVGYTGHAVARVFFDVEGLTLPDGSYTGSIRVNLDEAHALLFGIMTTREAIARGLSRVS